MQEVVTFAAVAMFVWAGLILAKMSRELGDLKEVIAEIRSLLDRQQGELESQRTLLLAIDNQTMSAHERARREWENMTDVTIDYLRGIAPGLVIDLVSCSFVYPVREPVFEHFEYKVKVITDTEGEFGREILGRARFGELGDWEDVTVYASAERTLTSTCEGTIRRRETPEEILERVHAKDRHLSA